MACAYFNEYCKTRSKDEKLEAMEVLHKKYAPEMLNIILRMKGYYVKCAQMGVGADLLPKAYENEFKILLD